MACFVLIFEWGKKISCRFESVRLEVDHVIHMYVTSCPARRSMSEPTHFFWRNASLLAWWICCALGVCLLGHFQFVQIAKIAVTYPLRTALSTGVLLTDCMVPLAVSTAASAVALPNCRPDAVWPLPINCLSHSAMVWGISVRATGRFKNRPEKKLFDTLWSHRGPDVFS